MKTFSQTLSIIAAFAQFGLLIFAILAHDYVEAIAWGSCMFYNLSSSH